MKLVTTIALVIVPLACLAQKQTLLVGGRCMPLVPELQRLLGAEYRVLDMNHRRDARGTKSRTLLFLEDFTPSSDDAWGTWSQGEDAFVAGTRSQIVTAFGIVPKSNFKIILPSGIKSRIYAEDYVPLIRQIARELDVAVIDLSKSTDPAKDLYLQLATFQRNPGTWHVVSATSEQTDEGPATNAIDNNPDTYWHTRYDPNPTKVPHEIIIDLGKSQTLDGFSYLARQDGGVNGRVKDFEIYLSDDSAKWGDPVMKGALQNKMNEQRLLFPQAATGRYLKFKALSEVNANIWTSIAELGILPTGKPK